MITLLVSATAPQPITFLKRNKHIGLLRILGPCVLIHCVTFIVLLCRMCIVSRRKFHTVLIFAIG